LEEVSTTCDSGWVRSGERARLTHPPAIAGGTDTVVHLRGTGNTKVLCVFDHRSISALALGFSVPVRRTVTLEAISD